MSEKSTQQKTSSYHFHNNVLLFNDKYVGKRNDSISFLVDIDPDRPRILKHGLTMFVTDYAANIRNMWDHMDDKDRYYLGVPIMYVMAATDDNIALMNQILEKKENILKLQSTLTKHCDDLGKPNNIFHIYSAITGERAKIIDMK